MSSIYTYNLLTPSATAGADVALVNSTLKVTGAPSVNMKEATVSQLLDPVTELREVVTLTPTQSTAIGQVYSIRIQQVNRGRNISKTFAYTSVTAADTTTTISNAFRTMINLDPELSVVATGTTTVVLTAASTGVDLAVTIISTGAGLTQASTFVDSTGSAVSPATTYTASTASNVITVLRGTGTQTNLQAGMYVSMTLTGADTITLRDGTVITSASGAQKYRIGGTITNGGGAGDQFQVSPVTDANIEAASVSAAPVVALAPSPVRGTGAELASRGVVGAVPATVYAEVKLNWLETPPNGGAAISKSHSVFVDTTSASNYGAFRYKVINAMGAVTSSTSAFNTTATPEASAIL